ncbi:hypothetical protein JIX56_42045 [Streptomyces sp. CA-210063]|uniref:hypothetical protein n=1 Tax=Streptomyces sp. CA-210063 TaxID=2801029 RepID=UPI00214C2232|nr:hypothetical protein [Streptomyces sp. CA-210063]UUU35894.1 hypothetical protein JIX56_42045 [Streptomyces sp. CA-210063]
MSEQTPSQAEGERAPDTGPERRATPTEDPDQAPRTTPSQAEGERDEAEDEGGDAGDGEGSDGRR